MIALRHATPPARRRPPWARYLDRGLTRLEGPRQRATRPAVRPALSRRSRSSRSSSGLGSKRDGSGSWSSPDEAEEPLEQLRGLEDRGAELGAAGLLDQAALGQASAPPTPRRRRGCGRSRAGRPAAGRRRSPASRPGPGSAAASAASRAGAGPPPRWPGRWRGRSRRRPRAGRCRACPRRGPRAAARSPRRPGPRSPRSPRARSATATGCGERKSSASTVRARSLMPARHLAHLDRAERLALLPGRPRPCGRAPAGRRRSPPGSAGPRRRTPRRSRSWCGGGGRRAAPAGGARARRSGGCG